VHLGSSGQVDDGGGGVVGVVGISEPPLLCGVSSARYAAVRSSQVRSGRAAERQSGGEYHDIVNAGVRPPRSIVRVYFFYLHS
jgi:hypothetical protein